ncbi:MAG: aminotransferase class I/II-fold pyridoxal phosphate-dependent enzyme, partial [Armatimonadetes bacterium]|nr:aminotransferase class I/II-fold pyridoxal phosphate-dependent enzyme [Armatimonadota bacterium]
VEQAAARFAHREPGYVYTRYGNPTNAAFEAKLAELEGAEAALAVASGMAAVTTAILASVKAGDHVVAGRSLYSSTQTFLSGRARDFGIEVTFVDPSDPQNFKDAVRPHTRLFYIETPGNPTLQITPLAAVSDIAREAGIRTLADNTFATPINQRPRAFGIDAVIHSATKYLGGHGDLLGGVIAGSREFIDRVWPVHIELGAVLSPFHAFLITRGMQTLPLRIAAHNQNALAIARFLENHPLVARVTYPGLPSHPQHATAIRQMTGFGGVICFEVADAEKGRRVMNAVRLCTLTVSLGDTKTLICHPASMTHAHVASDLRLTAGISDGLIRLSVGIEDPEDLMEDLDQALRD